MLKANAKTTARKDAFARKHRNGPSLFNPHYAIGGRAVQDPALSSQTGPQMKTLQWEATGRRAHLDLNAVERGQRIQAEGYIEQFKNKRIDWKDPRKA